MRDVLTGADRTIDVRDAGQVCGPETGDPQTFIVFNISHDTHDPNTAHLAGHGKLPDLLVSFGQKESAAIAGTPTYNKQSQSGRISEPFTT